MGHKPIYLSIIIYKQAAENSSLKVSNETMNMSLIMAQSINSSIQLRLIYRIKYSVKYKNGKTRLPAKWILTGKSYSNNNNDLIIMVPASPANTGNNNIIAAIMISFLTAAAIGSMDVRLN